MHFKHLKHVMQQEQINYSFCSHICLCISITIHIYLLMPPSLMTLMLIIQYILTLPLVGNERIPFFNHEVKVLKQHAIVEKPLVVKVEEEVTLVIIAYLAGAPADCWPVVNCCTLIVDSCALLVDPNSSAFFRHGVCSIPGISMRTVLIVLHIRDHHLCG